MVRLSDRMIRSSSALVAGSSSGSVPGRYNICITRLVLIWVHVRNVWAVLPDCQSHGAARRALDDADHPRTHARQQPFQRDPAWSAADVAGPAVQAPDDTD